MSVFSGIGVKKKGECVVQDKNDMKIALKQAMEYLDKAQCRWAYADMKACNEYRKKADKIMIIAIQREARHNLSDKKALSIWQHVYETQMKYEQDIKYQLWSMKNFIEFVDQMLD